MEIDRILGAKQLSTQLLKNVRGKALVADGDKTLLAKAELSAQNVLEVLRRHVMRDLSQFVREDEQVQGAQRTHARADPDHREDRAGSRRHDDVPD